MTTQVDFDLVLTVIHSAAVLTAYSSHFMENIMNTTMENMEASQKLKIMDEIYLNVERTRRIQQQLLRQTEKLAKLSNTQGMTSDIQICLQNITQIIDKMGYCDPTGEDEDVSIRVPLDVYKHHFSFDLGYVPDENGIVNDRQYWEESEEGESLAS